MLANFELSCNLFTIGKTNMKKSISLYTCILGCLVAVTSANSLADPSIITGINYGSCPSVEKCENPQYPILTHHHCINNTTKTTYQADLSITIQGSTIHLGTLPVRPGLTDFYDCAKDSGHITAPVKVEYDFSTFKLFEKYDLLDHAPYSSPFVSNLTVPLTKADTPCQK